MSHRSFTEQCDRKHQSVQNVGRFQKAMGLSFAIHGVLIAAVIGLVGGVGVENPTPDMKIELISQAPQNSQGQSDQAEGEDQLQRQAEEERERQRAMAKAARALLAKQSEQKSAPAPLDLPTEQAQTPELGESDSTSDAEQAQSAATGAAGQVVAASDAVSADAWLQVQMLDWLDRHKTYPRAAKREHLEGVVQVRFTVNADGKLERAAMEKSSGHKILDRAAMSLISRAAPFPISLRDFGLARLEFSLPIAYRLKDVIEG